MISGWLAGWLWLVWLVCWLVVVGFRIPTHELQMDFESIGGWFEKAKFRPVGLVGWGGWRWLRSVSC